jgi:hypothetical protein
MSRTWQLLIGLSAMSLFSLIVLDGAAGLGKQPTKVEICHLNADGAPDTSEWELLEVVGKAVDAHLAHGDGFPGGEVPGTDGQFVFDENCVPQAAELIFAVAYTDMNTTDGGYNPDVDVLIAKLIDGPGPAHDGILGSDDLVITDQYPKDFAASEFGSFRVTQHTVTDVFLQGSEFCGVQSDFGMFVWGFLFHETYVEEILSSDPEEITPVSLIRDLHEPDPDLSDSLNADPGSPSQPTDEFKLAGLVLMDQAFIDVELNCPSEPLSPPASPPVSPPTSPPMSPPISQQLVPVLASPEGGLTVGAGFLLLLGALSKKFYGSLTAESVSGRHSRTRRAWLRLGRGSGARGVSGSHMRRAG